MTEPQRQNVTRILGFDGNPLTMADLPAPGTRRWVIRCHQRLEFHPKPPV
jgi:hypothetical protein